MDSSIPNEQSYGMIINNQTLEYWVQFCYKDMCNEYGWNFKPLWVGCYGFDNLCKSIMECYNAPNKEELTIEELAEKVHIGWVKNYTYWRDNMKSKKNVYSDAHEKCCVEYNLLSDYEKDKDKFIANIIKKNIII